MDLFIVGAIGLLHSIAFLVLISAGLAIVFGMMKIINLAHGEFLTIGGFAAIVATQKGVNIYFAMLVVAPLAAAAIGVIVELLVIRHLYRQQINTMLATWGLSLFFVGALSMIFGTTTTGISAPIGGIKIGDYQVAGYSLFLLAVAIVMVAILWFVLGYTRIGLQARGAMQNPAVASSFGCNTARIYTITFATGTALAGLAGGVLAPLLGVAPSSGAQYIAKAFITVIVGGPAVIIGPISSSALFGTIDHVFTHALTPAAGEVALLVGAIVLLRFLPRGITGRN